MGITDNTSVNKIISVTITTDKLGEVDILLNSIEYLYVIEDIYSFCMIGNIKFVDRAGIAEYGPINGKEKVKIKYGNTDGDNRYKVFDMVVYKINSTEKFNRNNPTNEQITELMLVDPKYHKFHSNYWSRSWVDTKFSDIVSHICKHHVGISGGMWKDFENTNETIEHYDTHLRTPSECIHWLMNRSSGVVSGQPGYLLYQHTDPDGETPKWSFHTLEKQLAGADEMKPFDDTGGPYYMFENENPGFVNKIYDHKLRPVDQNSLKNLQRGVLLGYDIRRKKLIKREYDYNTALTKFTCLGKKSLFTTDMLELESDRFDFETLDSEDFIDNYWYGAWVRNYCNQQLLELTVNGHEKRRAGNMIKVIWPTADRRTVGKAEMFNKQMDGKYLVKSITHFFSRDLNFGWQQRLVCIKNGYKDSPNPKLVPAAKINV